MQKRSNKRIKQKKKLASAGEEKAATKAATRRCFRERRCNKVALHSARATLLASPRPTAKATFSVPMSFRKHKEIRTIGTQRCTRVKRSYHF